MTFAATPHFPSRHNVSPRPSSRPTIAISFQTTTTPTSHRDINRHDSLDRVSTFGSENHADLRADRNAIDGKNLTNTAANLQGLESTESISVLLLEASQEVTRLDAMMQNLYRRHPAKLHAWLAASRVERSPQRTKDTGTPAAAATPPPIIG